MIRSPSAIDTTNMIPIERMPSRHCHPSIAKFLVGVASKSTGIGTDHRDTEELELENALERQIKVSPRRVIISGSEWSAPEANLENNEVIIPEPLRNKEPKVSDLSELHGKRKTYVSSIFSRSRES